MQPSERARRKGDQPPPPVAEPQGHGHHDLEARVKAIEDRQALLELWLRRFPDSLRVHGGITLNAERIFRPAD